METFKERSLLLDNTGAVEDRLLDQDLPGIALDPYLLWACETHFCYYKTQPSSSDTCARLLIELSDAGAIDGHGVQALQLVRGVEISDLYTSPALHLRGSRFLTADVQLRTFLRVLKGDAELRSLVRSLTLSMTLSPEAGEMHPAGESSLWPNGFDAERYQALCDARPTGKNDLIVGIVDDGVAFLNQRFTTSDHSGSRTRFIGYWDQNSPPRTGGYGQTSPAGYGQVFSRKSLDDMLAGPYAESHVYRKERLYRLANGHSHGTAVLDIAAGCAATTAEDQPDLLAVQLLLPRSGDDNSGGWLDAALLDALRYMLDQVDASWAANGDPDKPLPQLIVNVCYSTQRGPHDGSAVATRAIDELIASRVVDGRHTLAVVFSAGNDLQARQHARVDALAPGNTCEIPWHLPADDDTPSFVELWADGSNQLYSIMLLPPGNSNEPCAYISGAGTQSHARDADNAVYASAIAGPPGESERDRALLALAPTNRCEFGGSKATIGEWTIRVHNSSTEPLSLEAWIQSDQSRAGESKRGRQSRFRDVKYRARLSPQEAIVRELRPGSFETRDQPGSKIKRSNTLNALATGRLSLSATGYVGDTGEYASYASVGREGRNSGPHVAAVSERSDLSGVAASSTLSGGHTRLSGTSAAAPELTRRLAALWRSAPDTSPQEALAQLIEADRKTVEARYPQPLKANERPIERLKPRDTTP